MASAPLGQTSWSLRLFVLIFCSIDCLYTNTTHLEVNCRVDVVKPGNTLEIPITFYPRESINYQELIPFEINGLSQQTVEIKGKGTEMKVTDSREAFRCGTLLSTLLNLLCPPEPLPPSSRSASLPQACSVGGQPVPLR